MREFGGRLRFVLQQEQEGYGHAVFQSRAFAGDDMVLLCLEIICSAARRFA